MRKNFSQQNNSSTFLNFVTQIWTEIRHTATSIKLTVLALALCLAVAFSFVAKNDAQTEALATAMVPAQEQTKQPSAVQAPAPKPARVEAQPVETKPVVKTEAETGQVIGGGEASYYGSEFAGRPTANGETFNPSALTAAHRTLPFGTRLKVTNVKNGKSVVVRVNDRGPYAHGRIIDLSKGAAQQIGMVSSGTAQVEIEKLS